MRLLGVIFSGIIILIGTFLAVCGGLFIFALFQFFPLTYQNDPDGTIILIGAPILGIVLIIIGFNWKNKLNKKTGDNNISVEKTSETSDLMTTLSKVDISYISSVTFTPISGKGFIIKTPNIKRLAVYISSNRDNTSFKAGELREVFDYIVNNISSDLSKTDFNLVQGKIEEFVKSGGEVKVNRV